jgi:hypothetical protein
MAYTSKNELTHGLGYGVVFTDLTGSTAGIPIAGLRAVETEVNQENTNFYAGFNAPYRTIPGAKNMKITVKSYDLPDEFASHALGFGALSGFLIDNSLAYKPYAFAYAERYRDDDGTGYKATFYPSVQATTPSDTAEADEESPTGKEYEHTATVTNGDFVIWDQNHLVVKFKVSDTDLKTGTSGPALAFRKLFNELKPLKVEDIKA